MPKPRDHRFAGLAIAIAVVMGACGGGSTATPAGAAPPAAPSASAVKDGTLPKPELASVKIGGTMTSTGGYGPKFARKLGLFTKYGLAIELIDLSGDAPTLQALTAGQIDIGISAASNAIASNVPGGDTPLSLLTAAVLTVTDALWCKGIKTAADLKGKGIGISTIGGDSHASALSMVAGIGLKPADVTITQVGNEAARVAALKGGSIACIVASALYPADVMTGMGASMVYDLTSSGKRRAAASAYARKDWLAKNPNTALVTLAAILEGQNLVWTDTAKAIEIFAEYSQVTPANAKITVEPFLTLGNRTLLWDDSVLEPTKEVMTTIRPEIAKVDLKAVSDRSFLQKLIDIGFYQKIGVPVPVRVP